MITKDGRDTPIEKVTAENYVVPKGEERAYHAIIEVVQYDQKTGKKLSRPRIQKFGKKMFETHVESSLRKQGYTVTILHDPNAWIAEHEKEATRKAQEAAEAKARLEKERFEAAVAEQVAKELAKIKAKAEPKTKKAKEE